MITYYCKSTKKENNKISIGLEINVLLYIDDYCI